MTTTTVVPTPPATDYSNLGGVQPDLVTASFLHKPNFFVVEDKGSYKYYCVAGLSKLYDSTQKKVVKVNSRFPVLKDGVLCLTGNRTVKVTVDDVVRGRVCKFREETQSDRSKRAGKESTKDAGNGVGKEVQTDDDEGVVKGVEFADREAADLLVEEQIFSLLYTKDAQALRRVKDTAHTRQLIETGAVFDSD